MSRNLSDVLRIMRLAVGRRNENDPDSTDAVMYQYINDFVSLKMTDDVKLFEQWGTAVLEITDGVDEYQWPSGLNDVNFANLSMNAIISLKEPEDESRSWDKLEIYQDPGRFFQYWGINNKDVLQEGWPTEVLYYDNTLTFRTVPNDTYLVEFYGYKINPDFDTAGNPTLSQDYWMRYLAYGAALDYARDYDMDTGKQQRLERVFSRERSLLMTRTHSLLKNQRCEPQF